MISVVIPSYRRPELILRLLADLYAQEAAEFEVIVVDDCSPDDSVEQFRRAFPQARIFRNEKNGGPAVARNRGIREARGDVIVGFDSDVTLPDKRVLAKVIQAFAAHPQATGFAFRLLEVDGKTDDAPRWWHSKPLATHANQVFETSYFSGTAYAFKREALFAAGLYPEFLYMHYEEALLAYRLMDQGGVILYAPELTAVHHAHAVSRRSEIKVFYKPRNQILFALECFSGFRRLTYLAPRLTYNFLLSLRYGSLHRFFEALQSAKAIWRERKGSGRPLQRATLERIDALPRTGS